MSSQFLFAILLRLLVRENPSLNAMPQKPAKPTPFSGTKTPFLFSRQKSMMMIPALLRMSLSPCRPFFRGPSMRPSQFMSNGRSDR